MKEKLKKYLKMHLKNAGVLGSFEKKSMLGSSDKFWEGRMLQWNPKGYWSVFPMPDREELKAYYSQSYWQARGGKRCVVTRRDLAHFVELKALYPQKTFSNVLNFGAGHGGVSVLFQLEGAKVTNIEPSGLDIGLEWECYDAYEDATGPFDLVYGSHSLEHLTDVEAFFEDIKQVMRPGAVLYFEVPNCHQDNYKSFPDGKIHIPHTYYFTRDFFRNLPYREKINRTYHSIDKVNFKILDDDSGHIIRYSAESQSS